MSPYQKKYMSTWRKAMPASGFRPETQLEWDRLQRASIIAACYLFREMGLPKAEAKKIAKLIYGGPAGRLILEAAFDDPDKVGVSS